MSERDYSDELRSYRPSLVKLTRDGQDITDDLLGGFSSREEVLCWLQRVCTRTFGEISQRFVEEFATQLRADTDGVLLAAFLDSGARRAGGHDVPDDVAIELREHVAAQYVKPAQLRAFRRLRSSATEYVEDADGSEHDPHKQRFIAMRPALDELEDNQQDALRRLLDGFDTKQDILEWGDTLQLATHGELPEDLITRCYSENATAGMLCGGSRVHKRGRELFAATYLLPAYNKGVRDLSGRATEQPDSEREEREVTPA